MAWEIRTTEDSAHDKIVKNVMEFLDYGEEAVSVTIEEVVPQDWTEKVYTPDIREKWDKLYKTPGYEAF